MNRLNTDERGGILVLSAVLIPVFLLLAALTVDAGNWFTHKRQLQNRADAGALAAGVEYLSQLENCLTSPGTTGVAIADVAKRYAGTEEAITGTKYNQQIAKQSELSVAINATSASAADSSDGGSPCIDHDPGDSISPGGYWTDVKVRETNLGTLFKGLGLNLPSVTAQARVEVKQLIGIRHGGLPFVNETGDYVQCAWARFVNVRTGSTSGILANGASNPVALVKDPNTPRHWTADVPDGIDITSSRDDIAVEYYMGTSTSGSCDFSTDFKGAVPGNNGNPVAIDWINVYNDDTPGANAAPLLHHFTLTPGTCGPTTVGFIFSPTACTITFSAEVDHGTNPAPSKIFVDVEDPDDPTSPSLSSVEVSGSGPYYTGQLTFNPTEVSGDPNVSQDFTQVGRHRLKVRWEQTAGRVGSHNCTNPSPCTGTFLSEQAGNWQHATYVADPLRSHPLQSAELLSGGSPLQNSWAGGGPDTGQFTIDVTAQGIDQDNLVTVRDSVQASGNRTGTVDCGQGNGTSGLISAIVNGCPNQMLVNQRAGSCSPAPPLPNGAWDCVSTVPGNRTATGKGFEDRFSCSMPNNWVNGTSPSNLSDTDPRYAYIFLTDFGRVANVHPNRWLPIRAFLRIYVTGWDDQHSWVPCGGDNDPPPQGYDGHGAQLWGHFVDVITLSDDVLPGDAECDLSVSLVTCQPVLVR